MRYALIRGDVVENVIIAEAITTEAAVAEAIAAGEPVVGVIPPAGTEAVPAPDFVFPGCVYDGETFSLPPAPETPAPVLPDISDRQFFQALALPPYEVITTAEALAAVKTGELPAALQAIVDAIPDPVARFNAEMILSGATTFSRSHPMVAAIAGAMTPPMTSPEVDAFWTFAGSL